MLGYKLIVFGASGSGLFKGDSAQMRASVAVVSRGGMPKGGMRQRISRRACRSMPTRLTRLCRLIAHFGTECLLCGLLPLAVVNRWRKM